MLLVIVFLTMWHDFGKAASFYTTAALLLPPPPALPKGTKMYKTLKLFQNNYM
jgi:hypothetical protein